jgi:ATP-dependent Lon protease
MNINNYLQPTGYSTTMPVNKSMQRALEKAKKLKKNVDTDSDGGYETLSEEDTDSDSSYVPPKKSKNHKMQTRHPKDKAGDAEEADDDEDEEEFDQGKLRQLLSQMFPSKYINERKNAKDSERANKKNQKPSEPIVAKKKTKPTTSKRNKRKEKEALELEALEALEDDEDEEDEEDDEDEDETVNERGQFNIVLSMDGGGEDEDEDEYIEDDADCDSEDEQMFMKEQFEDTNQITATDAEDKDSKKRNKKHHKKGRRSTPDDTLELTDVEQEYLDLVETKKQLVSQLEIRPTSKVLINAIKHCKDSINKLVKKARAKNAKTYHKLIHSEKKRTNEIEYFRNKLSNKEQLRVMQDLKEINQYINIDKPYRLALLDSKMPAKFKAAAMQKLNVLKSMEPGDPEYYKIKHWVDAFMKIPFGNYSTLDIKLSDGIDVCHSYMQIAKNTLDACTYGLDDAKLQIMQMVGQWIANPSSVGTAIAIKGPMGTGKTTLVKEGISKILGREFTFIALGGTGDSSFLEGHSYTYEGSSWGKIVQILIDSKCMNPVIYFDELDKISDTPRGEEIIGILTHLTDTTQNSQFHDKYFSEVDFDLSKCLFIFSYNDESKVSPILRDRMYRIQTKGYDTKEKLVIARKHLLPKIREQVNFTESEVVIPDDVIEYLVTNTGMTNEEAGVRNLKRCLEIIYTKLNLFRLITPDSKLFSKDIDLDIKFPITITRKHEDVLIKSDGNANQSMLAMYV